MFDAWTWHDDEAAGEDVGALARRSRGGARHATASRSKRHGRRRRSTMADRVAKFEAVKRWFDDDWMRIEPKLRTSIVEGISVFLSLFDDNPRVKYTFCPPKSLYEARLAQPIGVTAFRSRRSPT